MHAKIDFHDIAFRQHLRVAWERRHVASNVVGRHTRGERNALQVALLGPRGGKQLINLLVSKVHQIQHLLAWYCRSNDRCERLVGHIACDLVLADNYATLEVVGRGLVLLTVRVKLVNIGLRPRVLLLLNLLGGGGLLRHERSTTRQADLREKPRTLR
eukprot:Mycagemm_TRINITY_DN10370_c2_g2::TRINITY_DN10370_c2_g2_i3::g.1116::m.1116 type:complete len:158 gc:universal TRINITY_DN10370_c2_g2_i3:478-5(-)